MTGIVYGRFEDGEDIHLWKIKDERYYVTRCGKGPEIDSKNPEQNLLVTQKESLEGDISDAYCDECVRKEPKID